MEKILLAALAALTVFSLTSCMSRTEKKQRTITVTGTGTVFVENKEAALSLSVVSRDEDVLKASEQNAEKMTAVMKAVSEAGVGSDAMHTTDYSIWQEEKDNQYTRKTTTQYVVSNRLKVTVKDIAKTGAIIDAAIKAGANKMNSLSYSAGDTSEAEKQARILAVRNADQKANVLVSTSGLTLGKVIFISEYDSNYGSARNADFVKAKMAATPISGGSSSVSITVDVTYELKD